MRIHSSLLHLTFILSHITNKGVLANTSDMSLVCPSATEGTLNLTVHCITRTANTLMFRGSSICSSRHSIQCDLNTCISSPGVKGHVVINSTHVDTVMLIEVVEKSHSGEWQCDNTFILGPIRKNCSIEIYAPPELPECTWDSNFTHVVVTCTTSKVYPQRICRWNIVVTNATQQLKRAVPHYSTSTHVNYTNDYGAYFRTTCVAVIVPQVSGHYVFVVTVSPDSLVAAAARVSKNITVTIDIPECPSNLSYQRTDKHKVTLSWKSGYNGGLKQTFRLLKLEDPASNTTYDNILEENSNTTITLTNLTTNTSFIVSIDAYSQLGLKRCSHLNITIFLDDDVHHQEKAVASSSHIIVIIVFFFVVIILGLLIIVFIKRKHKWNKADQMLVLFRFLIAQKEKRHTSPKYNLMLQPQSNFDAGGHIEIVSFTEISPYFDKSRQQLGNGSFGDSCCVDATSLYERRNQEEKTSLHESIHTVELVGQEVVSPQYTPHATHVQGATNLPEPTSDVTMTTTATITYTPSPHNEPLIGQNGNIKSDDESKVSDTLTDTVLTKEQSHSSTIGVSCLRTSLVGEFNNGKSETREILNVKDMTANIDTGSNPEPTEISSQEEIKSDSNEDVTDIYANLPVGAEKSHDSDSIGEVQAHHTQSESVPNVINTQEKYDNSIYENFSFDRHDQSIDMDTGPDKTTCGPNSGRSLSKHGLIYVSMEIDPETTFPVFKSQMQNVENVKTANHESVEYSSIDLLATSMYRFLEQKIKSEKETDHSVYGNIETTYDKSLQGKSKTKDDKSLDRNIKSDTMYDKSLSGDIKSETEHNL